MRGGNRLPVLYERRQRGLAPAPEDSDPRQVPLRSAAQSWGAPSLIPARPEGRWHRARGRANW
eukprot:9430566-Alexandrium_andersonii.AAC.1